jgi:hypothetical protein
MAISTTDALPTQHVTDWSKPKAIDQVTLAFPANVVGTYLPPRDVIPEDFDRNWHHDSHEWCGVANRWFSEGIEKSEFKPKDGIDEAAAWRHLSACMRSFEPKHEHKIAGVAWLMSMWFDKASGDEHGAEPK